MVLSSKAWYLLCLPRLSRAVFRSHCDLEGLIEQSVVFTVSSKAQSSWLFEVTAILKAQSSKAWYLQCSEHGIHEVGSLSSSGSSTQTGDSGSVEQAFRSHCNFEGSVEQSMVLTVFSKAQPSWLFEVTAILKA